MLWVRDEGGNGPPSPERLATLGQRFARTAASRGGDSAGGLGLSIGHAVAQAFGGELAFEHPAAGGFRALLRLPLAPEGGSAEDGPPHDNQEGRNA